MSHICFLHDNLFSDLRKVLPHNHSKDETHLLLTMLIPIFTKYGFCIEPLQDNTDDLDEYNFVIEFHDYTVNGREVQSEFVKHIDDYSALSCNVNTIIFCLEKSDGIIGGDLIVYEGETVYPSIIKIKSNMMIVMSGTLEHEILVKDDILQFRWNGLFNRVQIIYEIKHRIHQ